VTFASGGTLPGRTLYIGATLVDSAGNESAVSGIPSTVYIPENNLLTAASPAPEVASGTLVTYNSWNVYIGTSPSALEKQNSTPIAIGTSFTELSTGSISGAAPPISNGITPINGYVIEFRYFQQRKTIHTQADALQIPLIYKDVVVAGVNFFIEMFLRQSNDVGRAGVWKSEFETGIKQIRKDLNLNFRNTDFISPDSATNYTHGYLSRYWY
jgi:hypothetical protein